VKRKDFSGIQLAQGLIEGAKKMRDDVRGEESKTKTLQSRVDRKKTGLITAFLKKSDE